MDGLVLTESGRKQKVGRLFSEEWNKLIHARSVRIIFLIFVGWGVFSGIFLDRSADRAPFSGYYTWGPAGFYLIAVLAATRTAGEYQSGRLAEALGAGVSRGRYFAAKVLTLFCLSACFYLANVTVFSLLRLMLDGIPAGGGYRFPSYGLQVLVYQLGMVLLYWFCVAAAVLCGVLLRKKSQAGFLTAAVLLADQFISLVRFKQIDAVSPGQSFYGGPVAVCLQMDRYESMGSFLTYDFALQFLPCVYVGILALILGYFVFSRNLPGTGEKPQEGQA